jgi:Secretion system C-terminal sorting domain
MLKQRLIILLFLFISFHPLAQEKMILKPDGTLHKNRFGRLNEVKRLDGKIIQQFNTRNYYNSNETAIDTLQYMGIFDSNFGMFGQDWMLQWYIAPADLIIKEIGFNCTDDFAGTYAEVKIVKVNWTGEELQNSETQRRGYYEAVGNGYNDITAFLDNPDRTGGWTSIQPGDSEPFGEDLWSNQGAGLTVLPVFDGEYQWVQMMDLGYEPEIQCGEVFGVAIRNLAPNMDENRIGFLSGIIGYPGWKFYANGRLEPGADYGWWTREYTWDFPVVVEFSLTNYTWLQFLDYTILSSTLSTAPREVEARVTGPSPPGTIYDVKVHFTTNYGVTWDSTEMSYSGDELYFGEIPGFPPSTSLTYYYEANDTTNPYRCGYHAVTINNDYYIFAPSGAQTLVIYNGFDTTNGFPQDYYFGSDVFDGTMNFSHDRWAYGPIPPGLLDSYYVIFEFCNSMPDYFTDDLVRPWLESNPNHHYFLSGQDWLGFRYGWADTTFIPGEFEYDILGLIFLYNDVSYDLVSGHEIPSLLFAKDSTLFGEPLLNLFNSLIPPADSIMYNPNFIQGYYNWIDAIDVVDDATVDIQVRARSSGGPLNEWTGNTMLHRELPAGNKIVFLAFDPLSITTADNDSYPYYYWIGFDTSNVTFQALRWFGVNIVTDITDEEKDISSITFRLFQNYPNPFNPSTKIKFTIPSVETGHAPSVQLIVYDVLGNEIATIVNEEKPTGSYEVEFDATGLPSGIYFYQLKFGNFVETKKLILLK